MKEGEVFERSDLVRRVDSLLATEAAIFDVARSKHFENFFPLLVVFIFFFESVASHFGD